MYGAIRIQMSDGVKPLPIQTAIGEMDPRIHHLIDNYYKTGGVGELCGLWNSKEVAGMGLSFVLTRACVSIINQIKFRTLVGICAEYTLKMFRSVGFVIDESLGLKGEFAYPNPTYVTRVLGILNAETLETAEPFDKERMLSLREDPQITRQENGPKGYFEVEYRMLL